VSNGAFLTFRQVGVVNFTWRAGDRKYFYNFDRLQSFNSDILRDPIVSIETKGRIPRRPRCEEILSAERHGGGYDN